MMATTVSIKANDTGVEYTATLEKDGTPVDLTGGSVLFLLQHSDGTAYSMAATIVSAAAGTVSYEPGVGYPTIAGTYKQEWQATLSSGKILTFPSTGYNKLIILEDLN